MVPSLVMWPMMKIDVPVDLAYLSSVAAQPFDDARGAHAHRISERYRFRPLRFDGGLYYGESFVRVPDRLNLEMVPPQGICAICYFHLIL